MYPARPAPRLSRRTVLLGMTVTLVVPLLAACADRPPDPLVALVVQARQDAGLADASAAARRTGTAPDGPAAELVAGIAAARTAHADALAAALGDDAPEQPPPGSAPPRSAPPTVTAAGAVAAVRDALDRANRA
ncbi:MAG: hypothetical protein ACT4O0_20775, partial [Pseudonocardia sp.]